MFEELLAGVVDAWRRWIFFQPSLRAAFGFDTLGIIFARVQVLKEAADGINVFVRQLDSACLVVRGVSTSVRVSKTKAPTVASSLH